MSLQKQLVYWTNLYGGLKGHRRSSFMHSANTLACERLIEPHVLLPASCPHTLLGVLLIGDCALSFSLDILKLARSTSKAFLAGINRSTCSIEACDLNPMHFFHRNAWVPAALSRTCDLVLQIFAVTLSGVFSCKFFCNGVFTMSTSLLERFLTLS